MTLTNCFRLKHEWLSEMSGLICNSAYTGNANEPELLSDRVDSDNVLCSVLSSIAVMTLISTPSSFSLLGLNSLPDSLLVCSSPYKKHKMPVKFALQLA